MGVSDVGFSGKTAHSDHQYAIENYSKYDLLVTWEFAHKVMLPNKSLFRDISRRGSVTVKANTDKYDGGTRNTDLPPGKYYIDAYASVDILYKKRRAGHKKRIKYEIASEVTSVGVTQLKVQSQPPLPPLSRGRLVIHITTPACPDKSGQTGNYSQVLGL